MRDRLRNIVTAAGLDPRRVGRFRWAKKVSVLRSYQASLTANLGYLLTGPEIDNFTYELANEDELVKWISEQFQAESGYVSELLTEARSNLELYQGLRRATTTRFSMRTEPPLGRRLGWYVIVRLVQPRRMIETGIHDGIGSLVLLNALDRNAAEGAPGELVSFDVDPTSGWVVGTHPRWTRRIESTRTGLMHVLEECDTQLFLHDSLHTYDHELFELETAWQGMTDGILLSDNSHATTALSDVCKRFGLDYSFFQETPRDHFYPGGGIGLGLRRA